MSVNINEVKIDIIVYYYAVYHVQMNFSQHLVPAATFFILYAILEF